MNINTVSILPPSIRQQRENRQQTLRFLWIIGIITVIVLVLNGIIFMYRLAMETELAIIKMEKEEIEASIEDKKLYIETRDQISRLKVLVEKAMGTVPNWVQVIDEVADVMPNGIYLEKIQAHYKEEEKALTLKGQANSQSLLSNFMEGLDTLPGLANVQLTYVKKLEDKDKMPMAFEIKAYIQGDTPYQFDMKMGVNTP